MRGLRRPKHDVALKCAGNSGRDSLRAEPENPYASNKKREGEQSETLHDACAEKHAGFGTKWEGYRELRDLGDNSGSSWMRVRAAQVED